jgi:hypothetical protein
MDRNQVARELVKVAKDLVGGDKVYYEQHGIGKTKYAVNYHNGKSTHNDGSDFYDIALFSNKKALARFIKDLKSQGYKERGINLAADITMAKDLLGAKGKYYMEWYDDDGKRKRKFYDSLDKASKAADKIFKETGIMMGIQEN